MIKVKGKTLTYHGVKFMKEHNLVILVVIKIKKLKKMKLIMEQNLNFHNMETNLNYMETNLNFRNMKFVIMEMINIIK